ncbi:MAG: hypothetical protein JO244_07725 [Solirubrobacterales bacterium]|nr:hypothetical protein [Solirubrobacterales bacterium]
MTRHHPRSARGPWLLAALVVLIAGSVVVATADGFEFDSDYRRAGVTVLRSLAPTRGATLIDVSSGPLGRPVQPGFVGMSLEYSTLEPYAGRNPGAIDPVLVRLIRNLAPGARPVLRIGGDSTDWSWWPVPHLRQPPGVRIVIGPRFGAVLGGLARATGARLILGIDLEADSRRIAGVEAARLITSVGRDSVQALELGNEPELYGTWPWRITSAGVRVIGRAPGYGVPAYVRDYRSISAALPPVGLAGPALGGPLWIQHVGQFIDAEAHLSLVTVHTYPLQRCDNPLIAPTYPSLARLLAPAASSGLAERLASTVATAHAEGLPIRVDELNSVSCGGARGISDTFASALWALDTMFSLARVGADGVNIHTFQKARYGLFSTHFQHGRWWARVAPEYYGLLLFAQAAPPGSRLLRLGGGGGPVRAWATRARNGTLRIVLVNAGTAPRDVVVRAPGPARFARYEALRAPGIRATGGISLGGASFGPGTQTGNLGSPRKILVRPRHGDYVLRLPAASAVMLTLARPGGNG